VQHR